VSQLCLTKPAFVNQSGGFVPLMNHMLRLDASHRLASGPMAHASARPIVPRAGATLLPEGCCVACLPKLGAPMAALFREWRTFFGFPQNRRAPNGW
jgi:hypothetical protein